MAFAFRSDELADTAAIEKALRDGVDPDVLYYDDERWTVLHMYHVPPAVVRLIVDWGGDINRGDAEGIPPLWWTGHATTCMLENGADPMCSGESMLKTKQREIDEVMAKRDAVLVMLLSIPGLHRGLALRVGWWVVQTH